MTQDKSTNSTPPTLSTLIIDDEESIRELFKINLERLGYKVFTACNSSEAINIYKISIEDLEPISTVIIDLSIPGDINGKDIAKIFRDLNPQAKLIVSSGNSDGPEMINYKENGFDAALEKTFNRDEIKKILEKLQL